MNRFESVTKPLKWFMALLLAALVAGCGGGGGQDPILGVTIDPAVAAAAAATATATAAAAAAAACTPVVAPLTIPTVTATDPTDLNLLATTSTGTTGNKLISATFSLPMTAATITSTTFTLTQLDAAGAIVAVVTQPAQPTYNASTNVATLTVPALLPATNYKVIVTNAVTSASPPAVTATAMSCNKVWTFKTVTPAATGLASVNLGMATSFGIASRAGIATTAVLAPIVNGNVAIINTLTCNTVAVPGGVGAVGLGACNPNPPTINGTVYIPTNPDATTADAVFVDLLVAYNSITAAQLPLATPLNGAVIGSGAGACAGALPGCSGNATLPPGVYTASIASIGIDGTLTLDAGGNPDAVWVFQMPSSTLTTGVGSVINLIGGAKASNVWWQVGSSATIGVNSVFNGNVLAYIDLTINGGATSCGRLLSGANPTVGSGAIVLGGGSTASVPGNVNAPAGCL